MYSCSVGNSNEWNVFVATSISCNVRKSKYLKLGWAGLGDVSYQIIVAVMADKGCVASNRVGAGITDQVPIGLGEQGGCKHTCQPQQSNSLVKTITLTILTSRELNGVHAWVSAILRGYLQKTCQCYTTSTTLGCLPPTEMNSRAEPTPVDRLLKRCSLCLSPPITMLIP